VFKFFKQHSILSQAPRDIQWELKMINTTHFCFSAFCLIFPPGYLLGECWGATGRRRRVLLVQKRCRNKRKFSERLPTFQTPFNFTLSSFWDVKLTFFAMLWQGSGGKALHLLRQKGGTLVHSTVSWAHWLRTYPTCRISSHSRLLILDSVFYSA
jgi:hypothetical protein